MTQVSQLQCDVCGKTAALEEAETWWNVQVGRRVPAPSLMLSPMDQQLVAQAGGNAGVLNVPAQFPGTGMPPGAVMPGVVPPEPPFGSPKSVDACSPKCAIDFTRDSTKPPPKAKKAEAPTEAAVPDEE